MRIRAPLPADAGRLAALSDDLGYPSTATEIGHRLVAVAGREDHRVLVAESEAGEVVGWIHAFEQLTLEAGIWCEIIGLVVDQRHWGRGVGRALVGEVEAWARSRGQSTIKVRSNVTRAESHPFYQQLGFSRIKTQQVYRKSLG